MLYFLERHVDICIYTLIVGSGSELLIRIAAK